jgi:hypothetical protein
MTHALRSMRGALLLVVITACAKPAERGDTTNVLPVDTVKPAATPLPPTDTTPTPAPVATKTSTKSAATKQSQTPVLRRDSIIRHDTKDPRRTLPTVDTTKKPPR